MRELIGDQKDLALLVIRIGFGLVFIAAGLRHIIGLEGYVNFFGSLGIPSPDIMATFVAYLELIAGATALFGLFTRTSGLLLAITMGVAIYAARIPSIYRPNSEGEVPEVTAWGFIGGMQTELILAAVGLGLLLIGPGKFSLDHLWMGKKKPGMPAS